MDRFKQEAGIAGENKGGESKVQKPKGRVTREKGFPLCQLSHLLSLRACIHAHTHIGHVDAVVARNETTAMQSVRLEGDSEIE